MNITRNALEPPGLMRQPVGAVRQGGHGQEPVLVERQPRPRDGVGGDVHPPELGLRLEVETVGRRGDGGGGGLGEGEGVCVVVVVFVLYWISVVVVMGGGKVANANAKPVIIKTRGL